MSRSVSGRPFDAVLVVAFGEPEGLADVRPFLANVLAAAVIGPIGFVCDHAEVPYDLDTEAAQVGHDGGLPMARAATVNDDPMSLEMMADEVLKTWGRYRTGRPLGLSRVRREARFPGRDPSYPSRVSVIGDRCR